MAYSVCHVPLKLCEMLSEFHLRGMCMPCSSQIISEMLAGIHTMEKCDFLKPIIHSQIY